MLGLAGAEAAWKYGLVTWRFTKISVGAQLAIASVVLCAAAIAATLASDPASLARAISESAFLAQIAGG
jgi:hypothetical protein